MKRLLMALALSAISISANAAAVRYTYTGNAYGGGDTGFPAEATQLTGFFEVLNPLGFNFSGVVAPTTFQFTDAFSIVTDATPMVVSPFFHVETDGGGGVTAWNVSIAPLAFNEGDLGFIGTNNDLNFFPVISDGSQYCSVDNGTGSCNNAPGADFPAIPGGNFNLPGTWEESSAVVPIPATAWLFGSAVGLLGWMRRRKAE